MLPKVLDSVDEVYIVADRIVLWREIPFFDLSLESPFAVNRKWLVFMICAQKQRQDTATSSNATGHRINRLRRLEKRTFPDIAWPLKDVELT